MPESFNLSSLPLSAKLLLTAFLMLIGVGYLAAICNLYHQHSLADGVEGMSFNDLRAVFHGLTVEETSDADAADLSRMAEMIAVGGKMRKHINEGGEGAIRALDAWLKRGALESEFATPALVHKGDRSARDLIDRYCLQCHNADDGEKADAPYGPDMFTIDYAMVYKFAAPGTAEEHAHESNDDTPGMRTIGPNGVPHLFLITHIHMLSIPVFTLIVSGLFLLTNVNPTLRGVIAPIPMLTLVFDFASWWLARESELFLYIIAAAGAIYGCFLAVQLFTVLGSLWIRRAGRECDTVTA